MKLGKETIGAFVVTGGGAAERLELGKGALDGVALAVGPRVVAETGRGASRVAGFALGRYHGLGAGRGRRGVGDGRAERHADGGEE